MNLTIKSTKLFFCLTAFIFVTSCGGGSDSSSSGAGFSSVATTYQGTGSVTLTADGFPPISDTFNVTIVIDGSTVTATVDGQSATATLNGDSFSISILISETKDDWSCNGTANVNGTLSGNTISGSISGSGNCSNGGPDIPVTLTGTFSASS